MTPEELERLVALGDANALASAVADLSEAGRKKLSKTAQALCHELEQAWWETRGPDQKPHERLDHYLGHRRVEFHQQMNSAKVAVLAVGPLSQAKKLNPLFGPPNPLVMVKVLADRRPEWIDEWVAAGLTGEFSSTIDWEVFWGLVREGVCEKPNIDDYYRWMAQSIAWSHYDEETHVPLSERLSAEPELLEEVWKLFEVDTVAFDYDYYLAEGSK